MPKSRLVDQIDGPSPVPEPNRRGGWAAFDHFESETGWGKGENERRLGVVA